MIQVKQSAINDLKKPPYFGTVVAFLFGVER